MAEKIDKFSEAGFEDVDPAGSAEALTESGKDTAAATIDEFEAAGFEQEPAPTVGEMAGAAAKRGTGAFLQTSPIIPGAIMGARIGALVPPPFTPFTIAAGAAAGIGAGLLFGQEIVDILEGQAPDIAVSSIEDLPKELRPYGAAGEVLGGSVPFMGAPLAAARLGLRLPPSFAGDYLNRIITSAGLHPARFGLAELTTAGTAAAASGAVEAVAPGRPLLRATGEIIAGSLRGISVYAFQRVQFGLVNVAKRLSESGRRSRAGQLIQEALEDAGEDPEALIRILRETDVEGVGGPFLTAAQKSGSRTLAEFEADLKLINQKFGAESARQAEDALKGTENAIALLRGTGHPEALRVAAELRSEQFRTMLKFRVQAAEKDIQELASKIATDTPATRAELSRQAEQILDDTLKRARETERSLWNQVPADTQLTADGLQHTFARHSKMRGEMLERETLPAVIENTIKDLQDSREVLSAFALGEAVDPALYTAAIKRFTVGNLLKLRSRSLALARQADAKGEVNDARIYGEIAEGILDDLSEAGITSPGGQLIFDEARRFSRELNNTFVRSFVGKAEEVGKRGAELIPPEVLLRRAFATGEEMGALQMRQIEEATRFLADRGFGTPVDDNSIRVIFDAQERIIRLAASQAVARDAATGRVTGVDVNKLRKFMTRNEETLVRFPETQALLESAIQSEAGRTALAGQVTRAQQFLKDKAIVSKILGVENLSDAVRGAIKSRNPIGQIRAMANLAKASGPEAVNGLRAAIWEDAFRSATTPGGRTSLPDLISALDDPIRPGNPSLVRLMQQQGLMSPQEASLVEQLVDRALRIQQTISARPAGSPPIEEADVIADTMFRIVGSRIATAGLKLTGSASTGPQLIAAGRGSLAARRLLERVPALKVQNILIAALRGDPITPMAPRYSLLTTILEEAPNAARSEQIVRQVHAYGVQAGYLAAGLYDIQGEKQ